MISNTQKWLKRNWRLNTPMFFSMLALLLVGVFFIYSACFISADIEPKPLYSRQALWSAIGLIAFAFFAVVDYRRLCEFSWWLFGISCVLLVVLFFTGSVFSGARRWFDLGFVTVQPSEFAKLSSILLLSWRLGRGNDNYASLGSLFSNIGLMLIPILLIWLQPDLGTAMVFVPTFAAVLFVAGVAPRTMAVFAVTAIVVVAFVILAHYLPAKMGADRDTQRKVAALTMLNEYQSDRVKVFLVPDLDPLGKGYNKRQSMIAVGSGGFLGKGYCRGTTNVLGFLPYSVAPTDFIYCVIAEEKGFVGAVFVLLLFGVLVFSGMVTAIQSRDRMGRLVCVGVVTMVFFHVFINVAMTIGLMPITGLPLPLLSYGGSFTITIMAALGIVQSVSIYGRKRDRGYQE